MVEEIKTIGAERLDRMAICLEASGGSGWLYDRLKRIISKVVVVHPGRVRPIFQSKTKTDRIDASSVYAVARREGADELRMDQFFYQVSREYLKAHPARLFTSSRVRLGNLWELRITPAEERFYLAPLLARGCPVALVSTFIAYALFWLSRAFTIIGCLGALLSWRRYRELFLIYLPPIAITLFTAISFAGSSRYLYPAYPCFCVFTALAVEKAITWRSFKRSPPSLES